MHYLSVVIICAGTWMEDAPLEQFQQMSVAISLAFYVFYVAFIYRFWCLHSKIKLHLSLPAQESWFLDNMPIFLAAHKCDNITDNRNLFSRCSKTLIVTRNWFKFRMCCLSVKTVIMWRTTANVENYIPRKKNPKENFKARDSCSLWNSSKQVPQGFS